MVVVEEKEEEKGRHFQALSFVLDHSLQFDISFNFLLLYTVKMLPLVLTSGMLWVLLVPLLCR